MLSCINIVGCPERNDINACIVLPGTHRSARRMRLKSWHLLQPIANISFVCFICQNFILSKILSSNVIFRNFIYNANGIFIVLILLPGTSTAFTFSVLLPGALIYVILPGTRRYVDMFFSSECSGLDKPRDPLPVPRQPEASQRSLPSLPVSGTQLCASAGSGQVWCLSNISISLFFALHCFVYLFTKVILKYSNLWY